MIRIAIYNPRSGTGKSTTTVTLARVFADQGKKVLIVDTDPTRTSIASLLGLSPTVYLSDFILKHLAIQYCVTSAGPNIAMLCSNRTTDLLEARLLAFPSPEVVIGSSFALCECFYDVILFDLDSSIGWLQTSAILYSQPIPGHLLEKGALR